MEIFYNPDTMPPLDRYNRKTCALTYVKKDAV
jgi:hypothetical protein